VECRKYSETAKYQQQKLAVVSTAVVSHEISQQLLVVAKESCRNILQINLHSLKHYQHQSLMPLRITIRPPILCEG